MTIGFLTCTRTHELTLTYIHTHTFTYIHTFTCTFTHNKGKEGGREKERKNKLYRWMDGRKE